MVDDDYLCLAYPGAGTLVEAMVPITVFARAGGGVGIYQLPDFGRWWR